jgi:hypothetical protein
MAKFLKLNVWNANGLIQHKDELKTFLYTHDIDVMLISETHFTEKSCIHIPQYTITLAIQPNRSRLDCHNTKMLHPGLPIKSLQSSFPSGNQCCGRRNHRPPHNFGCISPYKTHHTGS